MGRKTFHAVQEFARALDLRRPRPILGVDATALFDELMDLQESNREGWGHAINHQEAAASAQRERNEARTYADVHRDRLGVIKAIVREARREGAAGGYHLRIYRVALGLDSVAPMVGDRISEEDFERAEAEALHHETRAVEP